MAESGRTPRRRRSDARDAEAPTTSEAAGTGAVAEPAAEAAPTEEPAAQPAPAPTAATSGQPTAATSEQPPAATTEQPAVQPAAPAAAPAQGWTPSPQAWAAPTYGEWEASHGRGTPSGALRRAITGVPAGQWARDAVAALLLVLSLGLAVDFGHQGRERLAVVGVTLLALAALAVPYVVRGGLFADRLDGRWSWRLRLGLTLPYVVAVLVFVVRDLAGGADPYADGGVGIGLGVGLAGALLALSPRDDDGGAGPARGWFVVPVAVAAASVLWSLGSLVAFLVRSDADYWSGAELFALVLIALAAPTVLALGAIGLLLRAEGWRLALGAVAALPLVLFVVARSGELAVETVETVHTLAPGLVLWPAVGAAAWAPATRSAMRVTRARWADAAARLLVVGIVLGAILLLAAILLAADADDAVWVVQALLWLLYLVLALVGWLLVRPGRPLAVPRALAIAAGLAVVAVAAVVTQVASEVAMEGTALLLAMALPVAVAGVVLAQASLDARGLGGHPAFAGQPEWPAWAGAGRRGPTAGAPAPAAAAPDPVRLAQDPATPQATLADLATRVPETRVHIARHPAAYPALLDWLAALGDPEVTRAVEERRATGG